MRRIRALLLIVPLLLPGAARAQEGDYIEDDAKLFSAEAIDRANAEIARIEAEHHVGVIVITESELPEDGRKRFGRMPTPKRARYFRDRARDLARTRPERLLSEVDGVCVLVCMNPKVVTVVGFPQEREEYFRDSDREALRRGYAKLGDQSADRALMNLVAEFNGLIQKRGAIQKTPYPSVPFLLALGGGMVGVWVVLAVVLRRLRAGNPEGGLIDTGASPYAVDPVPAMLGSMFGAVPAFWLYDRLFQPPAGTSIPPAEPAPLTTSAITTASPSAITEPPATVASAPDEGLV